MTYEKRTENDTCFCVRIDTTEKVISMKELEEKIARINNSITGLQNELASLESEKKTVESLLAV